MVSTLRFLFTGLPFLMSFFSNAQNDKGCKPPIGRVLWHDRIDREQKNVLKADGKADGLFFAGSNEDVNYFVTQTIVQRIDGGAARTLLRDVAEFSVSQTDVHTIRIEIAHRAVGHERPIVRRTEGQPRNMSSGFANLVGCP